MFYKLISNLAFSPTLITEVGFYARRLRKEETTRRLTLLFVALTLVMQSVSIFVPPESANASSEQDIIRGGVSDLNDLLIRYDHNEDDVKDIYGVVGITRSEIAAARPATINATDNTYIMSRYGQLGEAKNEVSIAYQRSSGGTDVRYFSPIATISGPTSFEGWVGQSSAIGWFAIIKSNGSLATHGIPASISPGPSAESSLTKSISATLIPDNTDVSTTSVSSADKIKYTLTIANHHDFSATAAFTVRIADVLEYANLIDAGGADLDSASGTLSWPKVQLAPGESQTRTFAIQVLSSLPSTATGKGNPLSYDCKLTVAFGDTLNTPIQCSGAKTVEGIFRILPPTNTPVNIAFAITITAIVLFFYIRTRQLKNEIRSIRHTFNSGTL